ncbi:uroporphyrinogen III synthase [Azospirillum thiophilum]|uniref:Uroporphyrinogen III synthase n=1 Tax=Azospirillum thiophilum TaxID=528244 RepID=A0AAC8W565_9PROT|nr:uroporphyrinogen-III synthase [Azospirillum thiophilum]ALG75125.1 uroporphyrinogen III synthase [Azospirillum thiophilum]KJR62519.1 uroporphyrinogen III synthase [Azospirillum thiophilum]
MAITAGGDLGAGDLAGKRILVPESRDLDLFAGMMEQHGAETIRCPMVKILDLDDPAPARQWLETLLGEGFDDIVLLTGEGLRRLMKVARAIDREADTVAAIGRARVFVRGPKPVKALREIGCTPYRSAPAPTTDGVIAALATEDLAGRRVGVQLYPDNPNEPLLDAVRARGGLPVAVTPYRYANDSETGAVQAAIREMAEGRIDFVAFTASPQVRRLHEVADACGLGDAFREGFARTRIAAVGPVVAEAVEAAGGTVAVSPETTFHMKPLVNAIRKLLADGAG